MAARNIHGQQVQEQGTWENNTFVRGTKLVLKIPPGMKSLQSREVNEEKISHLHWLGCLFPWSPFHLGLPPQDLAVRTVRSEFQNLRRED
jgi:hypothetical protein